MKVKTPLANFPSAVFFFFCQFLDERRWRGKGGRAGRLSDASSELIAQASSALRRLHFKTRRAPHASPSNQQNQDVINTSTDSANTVVTMVTVTTDDSLEVADSGIGDGSGGSTCAPPPSPLQGLEPQKPSLLLTTRLVWEQQLEERIKHGRGSSGFAAVQMTIDSEEGEPNRESPPLPDSPTKPTLTQTTIVVIEDQEVDVDVEAKKQENMKLLEVANTLTQQQIHEFEMKYGSPHHSRSQSVRPSRRPNYLSLPQARTRVASMPNTGAEEHYYRLRHFSITGKGVVNRGDSLRSRRSHSHNSVNNSENSTNSNEVGSNSSSRQSSWASSCPSINAPYKVVMLGAAAVGKSSLISQFMTSEYLHAYDTSIDDEYGEKSVSVLLDGEESELVFIDHPCQEMSPMSCLNTYKSGPHAFCVVYSTADRDSFRVAEECLQSLWKTDSIRSKAVILVANKTDLVRSRVISNQEGKLMATGYDCKFIETSVGINHNVDELLVGILSQIRLKAERGATQGPLLTIPPQPTLPKRAKSPSSCGPSAAFPKLRGTRTSASLKVKGLLSKVWSRDSKSKSCENLHVL